MTYDEIVKAIKECNDPELLKKMLLQTLDNAHNATQLAQDLETDFLTNKD